MPQEDDSRGEVEETLEVFSVIFVAHNQSAEVEEPGEQALDFPTAHVTPQGSTILRADASVFSVGRNQFGAEVLPQGLVQTITVIRLVSNQAFRHFGHHPRFQRRFHQLHFRRRSAFCPQGERKTMAVGNAHDLGALAPLGFPNQAPPFLAGTKVPSTKHSLRSRPPAAWRCSASANNTCSMAPERTQFWKRRCTVW